MLSLDDKEKPITKYQWPQFLYLDGKCVMTHCSVLSGFFRNGYCGG